MYRRNRGGFLCLSEFEMAVEAAQRAGISWGFRIMQCLSQQSEGAYFFRIFWRTVCQCTRIMTAEVYGPSPRKLPLYTEEYLKYWEEMLHASGRKIRRRCRRWNTRMYQVLVYGEKDIMDARGTPDGPVVDLELGSRERMEEVVRRLIDSHQRAFPLTPMVLNLVLSSEYRGGRTGDSEWLLGQKRQLRQVV